MTKETIIENCNRLMAFYKMPNELLIADDKINCEWLLKYYERILDVNGAPARDLSILFIPDRSEFDELAEYCKQKFQSSFQPIWPYEGEASMMPPRTASYKRFLFEYDGYYWQVNKK